MYILLAQTQTCDDRVAKHEQPAADPTQESMSNLVGSAPVRFKSRKKTQLHLIKGAMSRYFG